MGCGCGCASNGVAGLFYYSSMTLFVAAALLGVGFIYTSMSAHFFKWTIDTCDIAGRLVGAGQNSTGKIVNYEVDMDADIGWLEFTISYIDPGVAAAGCFADLTQGDTYPIADYQDNSGMAAGFGMVGAWALAVILALVTVVMMLSAMCRTTTKKGGVGLTSLSKWCVFFAVGIVVATTVFWWMIEGKFGHRQEALAPRLLALVADAADRCNEGSKSVNPCQTSEWDMETPGWSLIIGITAMFAYGTAALLLYMIAPRVDGILSGSEEPEPEPVKHIVGGDFMADKQGMGQGDDKARGKDRRSARTGGRAPSSSVASAEAEGPDPMTYALEEGGEEETASTEEERVYQNHQVHPSIVNHSTPNATQEHVDETMSRQSEAMSRVSPAVIATTQRQRAYSRGYSRGNSGHSYTAGGTSFDATSEGDYSEAASSAFYHQGQQQQTGSRSFMSAGSKDSFDDDSHR